MIMTEDQEIILNGLSKYNQMLHTFSNYNNYPEWLKATTKLDETIDAVISGQYEEDASMIQYINTCIQKIGSMGE